MNVFDTFKIVIIDDGINLNCFHRIINTNFTINCLQISGREMIKQNTISNSYINHGTICNALFVEFLEKNTTMKNIKIISISINNPDKSIGEKKLEALTVALDWCVEKNVDLVLMSLGIKNLTYAKKMIPILDKASQKKITLLAAASNTCEITYPACFKEVIGVKKIGDSSCTDKLMIVDNPFDGVEVASAFSTSDVLSNIEKIFNIEYQLSNSWIVPHIGSLICKELQKNGRKSKKDFLRILAAKDQDQESSSMVSQEPPSEIWMVNDVPIIQLIYQNPPPEIFFSSLIQNFENEGYSCACLYDKCEINKFDIGIYSLPKENTSEWLNVYAALLKTNSLIIVITTDNLQLENYKFDLILYYEQIKILSNTNNLNDSENIVHLIFEAQV